MSSIIRCCSFYYVSYESSKILFEDAILTTCYLINWLYFYVSHHKTSYSVLFPNHPLSSPPSRVIGYVCFVHNFSPNNDEFDPHQMCIFLDTLKLKNDTNVLIPYLEHSLLVLMKHLWDNLFFWSWFPIRKWLI